MAVASVAISEELHNEFRDLVYQKYKKFGMLRTEADIAIKRRVEELKQELEATQGASN